MVSWDCELDLLWGGWGGHPLPEVSAGGLKQSDCGDWSAGSHYPGIKRPLSHHLLSRSLCFCFLIITHDSLFGSFKISAVGVGEPVQTDGAGRLLLDLT